MSGKIVCGWISSGFLLLSGWDTKSDGGLEGVIDPPLKSSKSTDHDDTGAEAAPDACEAKLTEHFSGGLSTFRHLSYDCVGRVRHNSAGDTGNVAGSEGDTKVSSLGV